MDFAAEDTFEDEVGLGIREYRPHRDILPQVREDPRGSAWDSHFPAAMGERRDRGRWLLSGIAGLTAVSGYLADWNRTHLFNPRWPPHAKFHDAWSILLGTGLGG